MTIKTYHLPDGSFSTSDIEVPTDYSAEWVVTPEQAAQIEAGADVFVAGTATFAGGPDKYRDNIKALRQL